MKRDRNFFVQSSKDLKGKKVPMVKDQANDVTMALINWNNHIMQLAN